MRAEHARLARHDPGRERSGSSRRAVHGLRRPPRGKGSDVNVASHLLLDVLSGNMNAALVISNDSDLRFPVQQARERVPVELVNPSPGQTAGALREVPGIGVGRHFWRKLGAGDFTGHQLPDPAGGYSLPTGW